MSQDVWSYYGLWGTAALWVLVTGAFLLLLTPVEPHGRKPAGLFFVFGLAHALEKYGMPFSLYLVQFLTGQVLPVGIFWGHTLSGIVGMNGHYLYLVMLFVGGGLLVAGWARLYDSACRPPEAERMLVRGGVYRYLRHPQYTGLMAISLGSLLDWATIPLLLLWPLVVRQYVRLAAREEQRLAAEFGTVWTEYAGRTGRFFPRLRRG